jgi:hypothetical protein
VSNAPTEIEPLGKLPDSLWRQLRERPERSPELIALAASERFAGPAEEWVRIAGTGHTPESLAREAYKKHVRLARVEGLALGLGGIVTSALNLGGLAWIQARMVFYIAAAQGYDPRHPMRPAELLALWGVYETPAEARASLDGVGKTMAESLVGRQLSRTGERRISERLMKYVVKRMAKRGAGRLIPFVGAPISAIQNGGSTKELGRAALAYYGGETKSRPD